MSKWWIVLLVAGTLALACQSREPEGVKSADCTDGKDNDLDGLTDCKDDGCEMFTSCVNAAREEQGQNLMSGRVHAAAKKSAGVEQ